MLLRESLPVATVNPGQIRDYARAIGPVAKSDRLEVLAWRVRQGRAAGPAPTRCPGSPPPDKPRGPAAMARCRVRQ